MFCLLLLPLPCYWKAGITDTTTRSRPAILSNAPTRSPEVEVSLGLASSLNRGVSRFNRVSPITCYQSGSRCFSIQSGVSGFPSGLRCFSTQPGVSGYLLPVRIEVFLDSTGCLWSPMPVPTEVFLDIPGVSRYRHQSESRFHST